MKTTLWKRALMCSGLVLGVIFSGCQNKNVSGPEEPASNFNEEIAASIAGLIAEDTGGVLDQIGDVCILASSEEISGLSKTAAGLLTETRTRVYDSSKQLWTVYLVRERGNPDSSHYAYIERTLTHQFINKQDIPQKHYIVNGDTANTVRFAILEGKGRHLLPGLSQELKEIHGTWEATGANTDAITLNGNYYRNAVDTINVRNATKIVDYSLDLTFHNIVGPRGSRRNLSLKTSGSITGTYSAILSIQGDKGSIIRHINEEILIEIGPDSVLIGIRGAWFRANPKTGEIHF